MAVPALLSPSREATLEIGAVLGAAATPGAFIALDGVLGAGKTQLVKGIALGLGIECWQGLRSPTFTLMQTYRGGRLPLNHMDFYRLSDSPDLPGEMLEAMHASGEVTVAEWADIWRAHWPRRFVHVRMEVAGETSRRLLMDDPTGLMPGLPAALAKFADPGGAP
ncbi:MAG: tRNA (adenosine(37)-N6)-threonylcarbamoyltransferase complex ATPase subunit type 1 TsaE [Planctomycetes bacterium]|nr:tRNA (adenosine(37)-N6)-threonylcarbamoyltransferase complex ATPase subunit type 1 TsaE [Planctomycetota bacterium]